MKNIEKYKGIVLKNLNHCKMETDLRRAEGKGAIDCAHTYCTDCGERFFKWLLEEAKEPILDEVEKAYLSAVIRPFRNRVENIAKCDGSTWDTDEQFICIQVMREKNSDFISLPWFKADTMYKGMETNKEYTLKELGL